MPSVTYLRLDGSVPAGSRHSIVNKYVVTASKSFELVVLVLMFSVKRFFVISCVCVSNILSQCTPAAGVILLYS